MLHDRCHEDPAQILQWGREVHGEEGRGFVVLPRALQTTIQCRHFDDWAKANMCECPEGERDASRDGAHSHPRFGPRAPNTPIPAAQRARVDAPCRCRGDARRCGH